MLEFSANLALRGLFNPNWIKFIISSGVSTGSGINIFSKKMYATDLYVVFEKTNIFLEVQHHVSWEENICEIMLIWISSWICLKNYVRQSVVPE